MRKENIVSPPKTSRRELARALVEGFWALMLPVIIIVGLKFGVFTPTEAAVVAAVYSLVVAVLVYRELKLSELFAVFVTAAKTTAVVMFLVAAALVSAYLITVSEIATNIVDLLEPLLDNQTLLLLAIMGIVVVVGTAMDMTPTILILTPILMPVIKAAGIDPVYFGVLFIVNNSIGLITPPVGTVLNVVAGVVAHQHGGPHQGRVAVPARRTRRPAADGPVPATRHLAGPSHRRLEPMDEALRQERSDPRKRTTWKERTHDASKSHRHVAARRRHCPGPMRQPRRSASGRCAGHSRTRWSTRRARDRRSSPTSWSRRAAARSRCGSFRAASSAAIFRTCPRSRAERSISWCSTGLVGIVKDFAVLDLPFLFKRPRKRIGR